MDPYVWDLSNVLKHLETAHDVNGYVTFSQLLKAWATKLGGALGL